MSKLTTIPWSTNQTTGKKLLRNRTGKTVTRLDAPAFFFWTDDERGEYDPYLRIILTRSEGSGTFAGGFDARYDTAQLLNLPGAYPWYASPDGIDYSMRSYTRLLMWAVLTEDRPPRSMTFRVLGMKIRATANFGLMTLDTNNFIGEMRYANGRYTMNGVDRGAWPHRGPG